MRSISFKERYPFYIGIVNDLLKHFCNGLERDVQLQIDIFYHNGELESLNKISQSEELLKQWSRSFDSTIGKIILSLYVYEEKKFYQKLESCYYDEIIKEYPIFVQLFNNILSEMERIIMQDLSKGNNYTTTNYDKDEEILIFQTVNDFLWNYKLPDVMNIMNLSTLLYEGRQCRGSIIFIKQMSTLEKYTLYFSKPIIFHKDNQRIIRKLLEVAVEKYFLVYNLENNYIVGILGHVDELDRYDIFKLTFLGQMHWMLSHTNKNIVEYDAGQYHLINLKDWYVNFERDWEYISEKCLPISKEQCLALVEIVRQQRHGAIIILSEIAEAESQRLCSQNRGVAIERFNILQDKNLIQKITAIDGAVMIGFDYMCYGIGIILDGPAVKGDASRGSRYNSALTYVKWEQSGNSIAIVVSEDGMINILSK